MKPQETKAEFIRLRAEGRSYGYIAKMLHISKSSCTAWERELKDAIADKKQEQLDELYDSYYMTKEARIKRLGDTLCKINAALAEVNFSAIAPEKLLDFKLKYTEALKVEYTEWAPRQFASDKIDPMDIVAALSDLANRVRAGEATTDQANREVAVITSLLRAYDTVEVKAKLDALEAIIGRRT